MKVKMNRRITAEEVAMNTRPSDRHAFNIRDVDKLEVVELAAKLLSPEGLIRPLPFDDICGVSPLSLRVVMHELGLYTFPTVELVEWLRGEIDPDPTSEFAPDAIEICAGTGWLGRALDIPITDSRLQEREDIRQMYLQNGQPPISYPDDVEQLDAIAAIRKYQPEFVIGSYVTHKWGIGGRKVGNMYGVDTTWVVNHCHRYYHIGNLHVHSHDPIMRRPHRELSFPWLVTRGDSSLARIFVWESKQWRIVP